MKYFTKEYPLTLDSYSFSTKKNTYILVFRVRSKQVVNKLEIQQVFFDSEMLKEIHPIDAYIVGIIYGLYRNKTVVQADVMSFFTGYNSYHMIDPHLFVSTQCMDDNDIDVIILKSKYSIKTFKVPLLELHNRPYLLNAIGGSEASKLGFLISEKFISGIL